MDDQRRVRLHDDPRHHVGARRGLAGSVVLFGQDLQPGDFFGDMVTEHEYGITVSPEDVPRLVAALGGTAEDDVLDLLAARGEEVFAEGETRWLAARGIEGELWSRMDWD